MHLQRVAFPGQDGPSATVPRLWDVELVDGVVTAMTEAEPDTDDDSEMASRLLLPALCHPHLHLDKALLYGCCGDYQDLLPVTGSFEEALATTAAAKARFTAADLHRRGAQLLAASHAHGVAAARVFVEVDAAAAGAGRTAMHVAAQLQDEWRGAITLQVCAFAQEALFGDDDDANANRAAMEAVLADPELAQTVAVLGTTPYVESTRARALQNLDWAVATALEHGLHLDVHLDYTLADPADDEPLVFALVDALVRHHWTARTRSHPRTVVVGHATQLTRLSFGELQRLAALITTHDLPLHIVGLPTSDLYMMGRDGLDGLDGLDGQTPRGTLNAVVAARAGLRTSLGVNNVGNAFTPHGTGDPLALASWGVGLYHAGRATDARLLYGKVSWDARAAMGLDDAFAWDGVPTVGQSLGRVLAVDNRRWMDVPASVAGQMPRVPGRPRLGFCDVVWDPPDTHLRHLV